MSQADASLLAHLRELEVDLHRPAVRSNAASLTALLHEDFQEFGRSGTTYSKRDVLTRLPSASQHARIVADRFALRRLADDVALLTYRSAEARDDGTLHRFTLRSSLWQRSEGRWQLTFHQGTAAEAAESTTAP